MKFSSKTTLWMRSQDIFSSKLFLYNDFQQNKYIHTSFYTVDQCGKEEFVSLFQKNDMVTILIRDDNTRKKRKKIRQLQLQRSIHLVAWYKNIDIYIYMYILRTLALSYSPNRYSAHAEPYIQSI